MLSLRNPNNLESFGNFAMNFEESGISNLIFVDFIEKSQLGSIWIALSMKGLIAVEIGGDKDQFFSKIQNRFQQELIFNRQLTEDVKIQLQEFLNRERIQFQICIDWSVLSNFQQKAMQAVCGIPYGETRTYGQIAKQIGRPHAPRAVGRANATNPMPLIIPCHRLVGADGSLRGYGGGEGVKTKAWLLALERSMTS